MLQRMFGQGRWRGILLCILLVIVAAVWYEFRLTSRLRFAYRQWRHEKQWRERSLWLPNYCLALVREVDGVADNLSALTWNHDTGTLFVILNSPPTVLELSRTGDVLRRLPLVGFHDTEAIEYIGDNHYLIAEEQKQKLSIIEITAESRELHAGDEEPLTLGVGPAGNWGVEGLAWDRDNRVLYAAKERFPIHIYEISGFPQAPNTVRDIVVEQDVSRDRRLFVSDISGLDYNHRLGHLLVLSDASRLLIEVDRNGRPVSALSLVFGNGLDGPVPQAEGVAMDDEETLFIVSEPNLFYIFRKNP